MGRYLSIVMKQQKLTKSNEDDEDIDDEFLHRTLSVAVALLCSV